MPWQALPSRKHDLRDAGRWILSLPDYGIIDTMDPIESRIQIQEELLLAKQSRIEGNEGRARVCARRAAGAAVQQYLKRKGLIEKKDNVLESLILFRRLINLPDRVDSAVDWLTRRVNQEYNFPPEVDLINEAGVVLKYLQQDDLEIGPVWNPD
jgi:hypothetical protein